MTRTLAQRLTLMLAMVAMACSGDPTSAVRGPTDGSTTIAFSVLSPTATFPGDRVRVINASANIRATASISGTFLGAQPVGATGTVLAGPVVDVNGDKLTRWQINFDTGPDGWAADLYLDQTSSGVGSVSVTPTPASVVLGQTVQLAAAVTDNTGKPVSAPVLTWTSSNAAVATVSTTGLVKGIANGKATVTATIAGKSATSVVTAAKFTIGMRVHPSGGANIRNAPRASGALVGAQSDSVSGTVIAGPVNDSTGDKLTRWQVDFDTGVDGWAAEDYLTTSTAPLPPAPVAAVVMTPDTAHLTSTRTLQMAAAARDAAGNVVAGASIAFSSLDTAMASVNAAGLVTGRNPGVARIVASASGHADTSSITVIPGAIASVTMTPDSAHLVSGRTLQLAATAKDSLGNAVGSAVIAFASLDTLFATVSAAGVVSGARTGVARIVASSAGLADTSSITVTPGAIASLVMTPDTAHLTAGKTLQLTATAKDSAGNTVSGAAIAFVSLDTLFARVSASGLVTGGAAGAARIVASVSGRADTSTITVVPVPVASVTVTPATASLLVAATVQLSATAKDSSGVTLTGRAFTWTSSDSTIAAVSASGLVTGRKAGSATISAASGGRSASAAVSVTSPVRPGHYVSAAASGSGDGSMVNPWTLAWALSGASGKVLPGDTVWLRGGTYTGAFSETVSGAAGLPIVFRQYPGERAIIDGVGVPGGGASILRVGGSYTVFWGFEITNSDPNRYSSNTTHDARPNVVANYASHTKYYSLIVHDGGVAFYNEATYSDVEVTDCIVYNNGWQGPDRGHGHALYLKSNTGPLTIRDNILFDQFGFGVHGYSDPGSGHINNIWLDGNVSFNNGTLSNNSTSANILMGGGDVATGDVLTNNYTYFTPGVGGANVVVGLGSSQNGTVQVSNGYYVGGTTVLQVGFWTAATMSANTMVGSGKMVSVAASAVAPWSWGGHQYYATGTANAWVYLSGSYTLPGWQSATGLGLTDATLNGTPATKIVVRKSPVEAGRANIIVYNWGQQGTATVDLSTIVPVGAKYEVHNVQGLFGTPVASGTGPGIVNLPLAAVAAATPVGMSSGAAPSTGTAFQVFVVYLVP